MISRLFFLIFPFFCMACSSRPAYQDLSACITPEVFPSPLVRADPPRKLPVLIVVDPGHGGEDQGTLSLLKPGYQEKHLTLTTAKMLREYLQKMGYLVRMTRTEDVFVPLATRAKIANDLRAALFISVHYNSAPSPDAHGIEIFYFKSPTDTARTNNSKEYASFVLDEVIEQTKAKSRGVKTGNFAVIRETTMPAILVEGGFLTNKEELEKIKDPQYLKKLAWGMARGIKEYLQAIE